MIDESALIAAAKEARAHAYVPYSHFAVGAAVLSDGQIYAACNIENASYGLSMCAERNAIFAAVAAGHPHISGIAVIADTAAPTSPCGACRQVMSEFLADDAPVILTNLNGNTQQTTVSALLPGAFEKGDMA